MGAEPKKTVSIIVVTAGINSYLKSCLESIQQQTDSPQEVIVIDNSRDKNFSQGIIERYPDIKLCSQEENMSYCEALNLGIKQSLGNFTLCLNDDVILDKNFLKESLRGFFVDSKVGMVSGKILRTDKETIDSTGLFLSLCRTSKERGYGLKDQGQFDKQGYVFGVSGAAGFYRREMLEDIKQGEDYFDSTFHFFYEDLDIAWRANRFGWKGYYVPGAVCYHVRGGSVRNKSGINKPFAREYISDGLLLDLIKNRYLSIIKNESSLGFMLHLPSMAIYDCAAWSYNLLFKPNLLREFFVNRGYFSNALAKRKSSADKLTKNKK